ncbi:hypothetical protein HZY83_01350, partial [Gemella sp. GH3]|uniref:hypothetical protein n=1 Tax=unclassified Gemella TaxID=2624949 RepID=UPI0015D0249E
KNDLPYKNNIDYNSRTPQNNFNNEIKDNTNPYKIRNTQYRNTGHSGRVVYNTPDYIKKQIEEEIYSGQINEQNITEESIQIKQEYEELLKEKGLL